MSGVRGWKAVALNLRRSAAGRQPGLSLLPAGNTCSGGGPLASPDYGAVDVSQVLKLCFTGGAILPMLQRREFHNGMGRKSTFRVPAARRGERETGRRGV